MRRLLWLALFLITVSGPAGAVTFGTTLPHACAYAQSSPSAPTAPASLSAYQTQGLAVTFTPACTGVVKVRISGSIAAAATTIGDGISWFVYYGTGTAPGNAGTITGSTCTTPGNCTCGSGAVPCVQVGPPYQEGTGFALSAAADYFRSYESVVVISGLKNGTTYWVDFAAKAVTTVSDHSFATVNVTAQEVP